MRLILIRHGEAQSALDRVVGGPTGCSGLSVHGIAQAEALRHRLMRTQEIRADLLLSSTLRRARQTAEIIGPGVGASDIIEDCDLCELHPGDCDGMPWDSLDLFDMRAFPDRPIYAGGESLTAFRSRVRRTLLALRHQHDQKTVVIACHGGVVASSLQEFFGAPTNSPVYLNVDNTSLTEWLFEEEHKVLVRYNDVAHLAGLTLRA